MNIVPKLIENAIKKGIIKKNKLVVEDYEDDEFVIIHKGMNIPLDYISILSYDKYSFVYIKTPKDKIYIYFSPKNEKLFEDTGFFDEKEGLSVISINIEQRLYCIELTTNEFNYIYINFITTTPDNCDEIECKKLNGLFKVLYNFLYAINYNNVVTLTDDVQINGKFITAERALKNNKHISIYEKYGFKMSPDRRQDIINAVNNNNIKIVKDLSRNIPMICKNITEFNQC